MTQYRKDYKKRAERKLGGMVVIIEDDEERKISGKIRRPYYL